MRDDEFDDTETVLPDGSPPVLRNQAGDEIDGDTEVPGPAPVQELVPLETDADGQVVPGYERCGVHPRMGQVMRKQRS